jgi:hypothetical protein
MKVWERRVNPQKALDRELCHGQALSQTTRNNELQSNQNDPLRTWHGQTVRRMKDGGQTIVPHYVALPNPYGLYHNEKTYHTTLVGSVGNYVTSPCGTRCAILAPPNNTTNGTQKTALLTMTVCRQFHKLPPLTLHIQLNIWLTYAPEKTFCTR